VGLSQWAFPTVFYSRGSQLNWTQPGNYGRRCKH